MKNGFTLADVLFYPVERPKRIAFTLAEVLITLGIIGVVAALLLPTLFSKIQDKELESRYKKSKSVLANGYKMMMIKEDMGSLEDLSALSDIEFGSVHKKSFNIVKDEIYYGQGSSKIIDSLPKKYKIKDGISETVEPWQYHVLYSFVTSDGFTYVVKVPESDAQNPDSPSFLEIWVDLNNKNKPNIINKDLYSFSLDRNGVLTDLSLKEYSCGTMALFCSRQECMKLGRNYYWNEKKGVCLGRAE